MLASDHLPLSMCIMVSDCEIVEFRKDYISSDFVYAEWENLQLINVISENVSIVYT